MDLLGSLAPRPGLDKNGKVDPFAPLGATPWSRGINQVAIDAGIPGVSGVPSKLSPQQMAIAALVDPAYQAHQVLADLQAATQASHNRWGALSNGDLGKVGSAYWIDPGTTFAQDVHTLLTDGNSATAQVMRALDRTPLGYAVPYAAAATGNFIGGAAHTAVNEARRWGPAVLATAIPGGTFLARAAGIDVFSRVKGDYKRDPVGTAVEDATSALAIASGGAGAAARVGSAARAGAAAGEGAVAGAGETAASGVARSQAGRSPWNATKDFAQSGWNHLGNLVTGDAPRDAVPRPGPGTPHRHDVGKPDRYVPPAKPTEGGMLGHPGPHPRSPRLVTQFDKPTVRAMAGSVSRTCALQHRPLIATA